MEYSAGFDLKPGAIAISGDKNKLLITLDQPELVASPSVNITSYEILSKGLFTDEKSAIIQLQQRLLLMAQRHAAEIVREPAVIALSEKKLGEFLVAFLEKQPGVRYVPTVEFSYRKPLP